MSYRAKGYISASFVSLIGAVYCLYWVYSRGAFSQPMRLPVRLQEGKSANVTVVAVDRGKHDFEIEYSSDGPIDVAKALDGLAGRATLISGQSVVADVNLPLHHHRSNGRGRNAIVFFTIATLPENEYVLSLRPDLVPSALGGLQAFVIMELQPEYLIALSLLGLIGVLLLFGSFLCLFLFIRLNSEGVSNCLKPQG